MRIEDQEQIALIKWSQQPEIRHQYPQLALLYHVPNERKCSARQGAYLKAMGVRAGVPDLCLPYPNSKYHGLYIEMKSPKGRVSPYQRWWLVKLAEAGYKTVACFDFAEARGEILKYVRDEEEEQDDDKPTGTE